MGSNSLGPQDVNHLLDKAVAAAARELLPCDSRLNVSTARSIVNQLEGLRERKAGFDFPETPVLYCTWYQLGHVNLAVAVAHRMVRQWRELAPRVSEMRVLDIGAGTLALPIAFDVLRLLGMLDINVRMIVIEPSREMEYCGRRVRYLFRNAVSWFRSRCDTTVYYGDRLRFRADSPFFFGSMHSMYPGIDQTFKACMSGHQPVYGLATLNSKERDHIESLERECLTGYEPNEVNLSASTLGGGMPMTFHYRSSLWERIQSANSELGQQVKGLLTNDNIPDWPDGKLIIKEYSRKPEAGGADLPW